jgi:hypothetical protein
VTVSEAATYSEVLDAMRGDIAHLSTSGGDEVRYTAATLASMKKLLLLVVIVALATIATKTVRASS